MCWVLGSQAAHEGTQVETRVEYPCGGFLGRTQQGSKDRESTKKCHARADSGTAATTALRRMKSSDFSRAKAKRAAQGPRVPWLLLNSCPKNACPTTQMAVIHTGLSMFCPRQPEAPLCQSSKGTCLAISPAHPPSHEQHLPLRTLATTMAVPSLTGLPCPGEAVNLVDR